MTDSLEFAPDWVSPPGDTIIDLLEERGWSQKELAARMGFSSKHVNELVKGKVPITRDAAVRLASVFGTSTDFWLNREVQYQKALARIGRLESLKKQAGVLKDLPIKDMTTLGWIEQTGNKGALVESVFRFFSVASADALRARYTDRIEERVARFRASRSAKMKVGAVAAWLRKAEISAAEISCSPFSKVGFRGALKEIRGLTKVADPGVFKPKLVELCAANGVAVVFTRAPSGCPTSGAAKWENKAKAILVLSSRYKAHDVMWFSFFHEAGHILLHSKKSEFIDVGEGAVDDLEKEADEFACDMLIPPKYYRKVEALGRRGRVSRDSIRSLAREIGVGAGIVLGRMQKEGFVPWRNMVDLKFKEEIIDN